MMNLNYTSHGEQEPSLGHVCLCLQKKTAKKITMKRLGVLRSPLVVSRNFDTFYENGLREIATGSIRKQLDEAIPQEILLKKGAKVTHAYLKNSRLAPWNNMCSARNLV